MKNPFIVTFKDAGLARDWQTSKDSVDLTRVATSLLGPAQQRRGASGSWWVCPFHPDQNPSFTVRKSGKSWTCFGCGASGDALDLVRKLDPALSFGDAVAVVLGKIRTTARPARQPQQPVQPAVSMEPSGLDPAEARDAVWDASERLWLADSAEPGRRELARRGISIAVADRAGVGWVDRLDIPTSRGGTMTVQGLCLPWWTRDGLLAGVKIRRMDGRQPKYVQAFHDPTRWIGVYPAASWVVPGMPLVITEGELDALCLASCLAGVASVVTLGSASQQLNPAVLAALLPASGWLVATDSDPAGEKAAAAWPASAKRIQPPDPFKDWCDFYESKQDVRTWWNDRLGLSSVSA